MVTNITEPSAAIRCDTGGERSGARGCRASTWCRIGRTTCRVDATPRALSWRKMALRSKIRSYLDEPTGLAKVPKSVSWGAEKAPLRGPPARSLPAWGHPMSASGGKPSVGRAVLVCLACPRSQASVRSPLGCAGHRCDAQPVCPQPSVPRELHDLSARTHPPWRWPVVVSVQEPWGNAGFGEAPARSGTGQRCAMSSTAWARMTQVARR